MRQSTQIIVQQIQNAEVLDALVATALFVGPSGLYFGVLMPFGGPGEAIAIALFGGLFLTAIGVGAGLGIAFFASRVLSGFVVGVSPRDPVIFVSVPLILTAVMIAACWLPARRASRIDPTLALRQE